MKRTVNAKLLFLFVLILITGCMEQDKRQQLEKVAKDWCTTIRASQVIPVYPLTEDIQPGDVFLVRIPIQKQADEYNKKGFLPLDQRMTRIFGLDYKSFYQNSFGTAHHGNTPYHWQFPPDGFPVSFAAQKNKKDQSEDATKMPEEGATVSTHQWLTDWPNAPRAMFPSYSFNVQSFAKASEFHVRASRTDSQFDKARHVSHSTSSSESSSCFDPVAIKT